MYLWCHHRQPHPDTSLYPQSHVSAKNGSVHNPVIQTPPDTLHALIYPSTQPLPLFVFLPADLKCSPRGPRSFVSHWLTDSPILEIFQVSNHHILCGRINQSQKFEKRHEKYPCLPILKPTKTMKRNCRLLQESVEETHRKCQMSK